MSRRRKIPVRAAQAPQPLLVRLLCTVSNIRFDDGSEATDVPRNEVTHVFLFFAVHIFHHKSCPEPSFLSFPGDID